jgi:2-hydroxy-3-keto-5-methylthiopentenyl-1-phosphate phosphatase
MQRALNVERVTLNNKRVLVTDFDGTMTDRDFYSLVVEQLLPSDLPDYWFDYREGRLTHFEALQKYFQAIPNDEPSVLKLIKQMKLVPNLKDSIAQLQVSGWRIVIASAGCKWYIDKLLSKADVSLEIHANAGRFESGRGLMMELPIESPFLSHQHGINKAGIVRHFLETGAIVAFAGDGFPDVEAAKMVSADLRFARRDLADVLRQDGEEFLPFESWSEIADRLIKITKL